MFTSDSSDLDLLECWVGTLLIDEIGAKEAPEKTYTVTYKPGANGSGSQQKATKTHGVALTLKGAIFTRTGYTQTGWSTSDGGAKAYNLSASYTANASVTLYPFWTANQYTVTLDKQGGSGGTSSVTATYGVSLPSITVPTRSGYTFGGYFTGTNGSGTQYYTASGTSARTWDRTSATTLYAKWTEVPPNTYTITYKPGANGSGSQQTATKTQGVALTLKGAIFTRTGYTQTGWSTSDGGAKAYNISASYTANASITLYPFWTANQYTVTLDKQGGNGGTSSVTATYGVSLPSITVPTRSGYTFGGYFTGTNGSGTQYYTASGTSARIWDRTSATTLYAKWTAKGHKDHDKVQLWEGGPYWATTNIGAENPEDCGYYFWWGDTVGYKRDGDAWVATDGSLSNFQFYDDPISRQTYDKSIATLQSEGWIVSQNGGYVLAPEHDAAHVQWGGGWRMPTDQELSEINSNCDWTWTAKNGVEGYIVRGRGDYAANSIFLPCAGYGRGTSILSANSGGYYWSSVPRSGNSNLSWSLYFNSDSQDTNYYSRYYGFFVRPVQGGVANTYTVTLDRQSGSGGTSSVTATYGNAMPSITVPTRTGYTFGGYFTGTNGTGTQYYTASGTSARTWDRTSAMTLYAKWTTNATATWTVIFNANGGSGTATRVVEKGSAVGVLPVPARDGYSFLGWFTAATGGTQITAATKPAKDVTYYAHWQYRGAADESDIVFVTDDIYTAESDGTFSLDLAEAIGSASTPKLTLKGLPAGLKYDSKTMTIGGKATKPGVYAVTVSATNATVKKPVTATFEIVVPNLSCDALPGLEPERDAYGVVMCGVAFDPGLVDCTPEEGWTVKAAGLPAGLKWDAKTGTITGVPTKSGTFTVTFTATKKGEKNQTATITLATEALPDWAVGTFAGVAAKEDSSGPASMTIAGTGKISGKFTIDGTNWTFSASSYREFTEWGCYADVTAKAGRLTKEFSIFVCEYGSPDGTLVNAEANALLDESAYEAGYIYLYRNMWKDKATSAAAKSLLQGMAGVYTASISGDGYGAGYLSLTVAATGDVKASGKLADGTAVSASVPLMWFGDGYKAWFAASPSAYKGGGVEVRVAIPQERGTIKEGDCIWTSRSPTATGGYGDGFFRWSDISCAYYDKLEKLNAYYETLRVGMEAAPELQYTYKETSLGDNNRRQTESYLEYTEAADTLGQDGMSVSVNEKGALVVAKATKPVQDRETKEWSYDGANDGALTLSFTQATGIFKGSYTFWYDYMSAYDETTDKATMAHTSKKVNFEGIRVQGEECMLGFYLWDCTGAYEDSKTGREKTYKYKESFPVRLEAE